MQCPECGEKVDPEEEFCLNCGTILKPESFKQDEPNKLRTEKSFKWLMPALVILMILLFVASNFYFVLAKLFPSGPVGMVEHVENSEICQSEDMLINIYGRAIDCSTRSGCKTICMHEERGICSVIGHRPLSSTTYGGECTCYCRLNT